MAKKKNFWVITQTFFVLEQNFIRLTPQKMGKIIETPIIFPIYGGVIVINFFLKQKMAKLWPQKKFFWP